VDFEEVSLTASEGGGLEDDGSGSGDEMVAVIMGSTVATGTEVAANNKTQSADSAIINHIYEIYSSITSMEHKVGMKKKC
jgi:hypothetical protein